MPELVWTDADDRSCTCVCDEPIRIGRRRSLMGNLQDVVVEVAEVSLSTHLDVTREQEPVTGCVHHHRE